MARASSSFICTATARQRLADQPAFGAELDRHGLRVIGPRTGRSWWTDKIWSEFDPQLSAERYVLDRVVPYIAERWGIRPAAIGLLGTGMGGQGGAAAGPEASPAVSGRGGPVAGHRLLPAVERRRVAGGDVSGRGSGAARHGHAARPSAELAAQPLVRLRSGRSALVQRRRQLRMKLAALGIPFECDLETSAGGNQLGVSTASRRRRRSAFWSSGWKPKAGGWFDGSRRSRQTAVSGSRAGTGRSSSSRSSFPLR